MKRKAVSCLLVLAAIMTMTPTIPTLAAENPDNTTQEATTTGTQGATITYEQDSAFTVTIPKTITLGQNKSATYDVKVKGDISGNETVTVTPDATLQLTDSNGKAAVTGTITQDITEFAADQVNLLDGGSTTGNIVANGLTSGDWSGNFEFAIGIMGDDVVIDSVNSTTYGIADTEDVEIPKYVTAPNGTKHKVVGIANSAFAMSSIKNITIPDSVTYIGGSAFESSGLTNITIPNSVTYIGDHAFAFCNYLSNITIPDSVTEIKSNAFTQCYSLTNITISNNITEIKDSTFSACENLTSVTIPDRVTSIEWDAFGGCKKLADITIPDSVTKIESKAFSDCSSLTSVTYKGTVYTNKAELEKALSDNNVTVGDDVFANTKLQ